MRNPPLLHTCTAAHSHPHSHTWGPVPPWLQSSPTAATGPRTASSSLSRTTAPRSRRRRRRWGGVKYCAGVGRVGGGFTKCCNVSEQACGGRQHREAAGAGEGGGYCLTDYGQVHDRRRVLEGRCSEQQAEENVGGGGVCAGGRRVGWGGVGWRAWFGACLCMRARACGGIIKGRGGRGRGEVYQGSVDCCPRAAGGGRTR